MARKPSLAIFSSSTPVRPVKVSEKVFRAVLLMTWPPSRLQITLKITLGMSWTQMGKSSMPAEPLHMRAYMCSQEFSDTESTTTLLGARASSHVLFSRPSVFLSALACSRRHSKNTLLLSQTARNSGSSSSHPATILSRSFRPSKSAALTIPFLSWSRKCSKKYLSFSTWKGERRPRISDQSTSPSDPLVTKLFLGALSVMLIVEPGLELEENSCGETASVRTRGENSGFGRGFPRWLYSFEVRVWWPEELARPFGTPWWMARLVRGRLTKRLLVGGLSHRSALRGQSARSLLKLNDALFAVLLAADLFRQSRSFLNDGSLFDFLVFDKSRLLVVHLGPREPHDPSIHLLVTGRVNHGFFFT